MDKKSFTFTSAVVAGGLISMNKFKTNDVNKTLGVVEVLFYTISEA